MSLLDIDKTVLNNQEEISKIHLIERGLKHMLTPNIFQSTFNYVGKVWLVDEEEAKKGPFVSWDYWMLGNKPVNIFQYSFTYDFNSKLFVCTICFLNYQSDHSYEFCKFFQNEVYRTCEKFNVTLNPYQQEVNLRYENIKTVDQLELVIDGIKASIKDLGFKFNKVYGTT